jgi:hypothetical protein
MPCDRLSDVFLVGCVTVVYEVMLLNDITQRRLVSSSFDYDPIDVFKEVM